MPKETHLTPKKIPFYKKKVYIILTILALAIAAWVTFTLTKDEVVKINTMTAIREDLTQEVSVTGSVEPAESVNLSFEISGKVNEIFAKVGDRVIAGQKLISLNSADTQAQLRQAQAGVAAAQAQLQHYQAALDTQKAKLDELRRGTRPEEIKISQTAVENAQKSLSDTEGNLETVKAKAEADIANIYDAARTALPIAVETGKTALLTLSDIQSNYFTEANQNKYIIETAKETAVFELLGATDAGAWIREFISRLNGGVYAEVQNLGFEASNEEIENALRNSINALQKVKLALNSVPITAAMTSTDILALDSEKTNINTGINTLSGNEQAIRTQKATSENLINTAENAVSTAENALATALDQLKLAQAGSTDEQIKAQEAQVRQAEANLASQKAQVSSNYANVQNYQAQLSKTILYAPISGLVTKMEAKVGEVVFPSSPYSDSRVTFVSIISDKNYKIETYVAEVDIAKIENGDLTKVTLDAYGNDRKFEAIVTGVDPAETLLEGIPTYKVTLEFTEENEKIKSGMTANLDIQTDMREMVIAIPQRAVSTKDGKKYVKILINEYLIEENEVTTGLRGSDGTIEITNGIDEGDEVVLSIDE